LVTIRTNSYQIRTMNKYERVPEFVLDLHGYTTREAKGLIDDIIESGEYGHIRVITGKGAFRETGPVMRTYVENYLRNQNIKFETAKLYNGGDGALEVYLK
jgi:DNA-nicking Smr family endonuclease